MAYSVETLDGKRLAALVVAGPLPTFGDELSFDDIGRFRVLAVEHRVGNELRGERVSHAVVIVDRDDAEAEAEFSLGAAMRKARRQS